MGNWPSRLKNLFLWDGDFNKRSHFLKIFSLFFAENAADFYDDAEMQALKKVLLDLNIKLNIFELTKITQACFWDMFFNFMTPRQQTKLKCTS